MGNFREDDDLELFERDNIPQYENSFSESRSVEKMGSNDERKVQFKNASYPKLRLNLEVIREPSTGVR